MLHLQLINNISIRRNGPFLYLWSPWRDLLQRKTNNYSATSSTVYKLLFLIWLPYILYRIPTPCYLQSVPWDQAPTKPVLRIRICIILGSWFRIRIKVERGKPKRVILEYWRVQIWEKVGGRIRIRIKLIRTWTWPLMRIRNTNNQTKRNTYYWR